MLTWIIDISLKYRVIVLMASVILVITGVIAIVSLPLDAFPDTTPVQVQINTVAPSLARKRVEQQITLPVELAIGGLPGLDNVRSTSRFGLSQVTATFEDRINIYFRPAIDPGTSAKSGDSRRDCAPQHGTGRHGPGRSLPLPGQAAQRRRE